MMRAENTSSRKTPGCICNVTPSEFLCTDKTATGAAETARHPTDRNSESSRVRVCMGQDGVLIWFKSKAAAGPGILPSARFHPDHRERIRRRITPEGISDG